MSDSKQRQRARPPALRREQDGEVRGAARAGGRRRPLEGMSHAHTSWPEEQDDRAAVEEYGHDEERARQARQDRLP